jgi:hypothetical protein
MRVTNSDRIRRNCVAQAVDSHLTCSTPFSIAIASECFAVSLPAISDHDASTSCCDNGAAQPN